jgi:hypothetical protein
LRNTKSWILAAGLAAAALFLLVRSLRSRPAPGDLVVARGTVTSAREGSAPRSLGLSRALRIEIGGREGDFVYPDSLPGYDRLLRHLRAGDEVAVWYERGHPDRVWRVERNGARLVDVPEIRDARARRRRTDLVLGLAALGIALWVIRRARRSKRKEAGPPSPYLG